MTTEQKAEALGIAASWARTIEECGIPWSKMVQAAKLSEALLALHSRAEAAEKDRDAAYARGIDLGDRLVALSSREARLREAAEKVPMSGHDSAVCAAVGHVDCWMCRLRAALQEGREE